MRRNNSPDSGSGLLSGTAVLGGAGLINRFIGFGYNTWLIRFAGTEPVGLYRMVVPLYFALLTIACAGIPYALARRVAEARARGNPAAVRRAFLLALGLLALTGLAGTLLLYTGAGWLAERAFSDGRTRLIIQLTAPGIWIVAVASVLRGYLQGIHDMGPVAGSQVLEQSVHAVVTVGLTILWVDAGVIAVAAAMALGMVAGELAGLFVLGVVLIRRHLTSDTRPTWPVHWRHDLVQLPELGPEESGRLLQLAGPVLVGNALCSLLTAVYMIVVPLGLQAVGMSPEQATEAFGWFLGIAIPLVRFPTVIHGALALNVIPLISRGMAGGRRRDVGDVIDRSLAMTMLVAIPVLILLVSQAGPIADVLFKAPESAPVIVATAFSAPFLYLRLTTAGILKGLGQPGIAMRNQTIGLALDILLVWWVARVPGWGIVGVAFLATVDFGLVTLLNLAAIGRASGFSLSLRDTLLHPTACAAVAAGVMVLVQSTLSGTIGQAPGLLIGVSAALLTYGASMQRLGVNRRIGLM